MAASTESRSQYLSLALNARGAMDSLCRASAGREITTQVSDSLRRFFSILLLHDRESFSARLQAYGSPATFEEVSALEEILPYFSQADLADAFQSLLENGKDEDRMGQAMVVVNFLGAVESKALQRYSESVQSQPY